MSNAWGALSWGQGSWAAQGDVELSVSGISATYSIGSVSAAGIIQVGWGGDTWGENEWGDLSGSVPNVTGVQLSFSIGNLQSVTGDASVDVTGSTLTATNAGALGGTSHIQIVTGSLESIGVGTVSTPIGQEIDVTGQQLNSGIGSVTVDESTLTGIGWGRRTWGNLAWGGAFSAQAVGQELTSTINFPATGAFTDVNVSVTSAGQLTTTFASPSFSIQIDQDVFVLASEDQLDALTSSASFPVVTDVDVSVTGVQATMSVGNAVGGLKTPVDVTGIQATMTLGTIALEQTTIEPVTGQQLTMTLGQHADIPGQIIGVGGQQLTSSIGSVTATGTSVIEPTGIQMTASVGSVNVTAWAEVNPGVNNIWSVVDRAA